MERIATITAAMIFCPFDTGISRQNVDKDKGKTYVQIQWFISRYDQMLFMKCISDSSIIVMQSSYYIYLVKAVK